MSGIVRRCSIEDCYPLLQELAGGYVDVEMINFVFPISAFIVSSSRWGSDSDSGNNGCLEKVIDL